METPRTSQLIVLAAGLSVLCAIGILIGIYPYRPNSPLGWVVLFLIGPPFVLIGEWLGDLAIGNQFVARISRGWRMVYAVILGCLVVWGSVVISQSGIFNEYFGRWSN